MKFKSVLSFLQRAFNTIMEGATLLDKFVITLYYFFYPLNKLLGINRGKFVKKIMISNEYGLYEVDNISDANLVVSKFDSNMLKWINLNEGVFIDVGAHVGKYSIRIAKKLNNKGQVVAIEAHPITYGFLEKNKILNKLNNITLLNKGVYNKKEKGKIFSGREGLAASSIIEKNTGHAGSYFNIYLDMLDNIVRDLKLNRVDLLKVDVEGADVEVIEGAIKTIKRFRPKIIIEISGEEHLRKISKILNSQNYTSYEIEPWNYAFIYKSRV